MAAAVKAKTYGMNSKRQKKGERSVRQQLRAAKRAGANAIYIPPADVELASAVAQLAATSGVLVQAQDELASIRVVNKGTTTKQEKEPEEVEKPKAAKPAQPTADKPKQVVKQKVSKQERKAAQAAARAAADDKRRVKREEAKRLKAERLEKLDVKQPAKVAKPKVAKVKKAKLQPIVAVPKTERGKRLNELRTKYNKVPDPLLDASSLAAKASVCEFDFSVYLKRLLMTENSEGKPINGVRLATAYLNTVSGFSKPLGDAIISPYIDEIRDALHAGLQPDETFHSSEVLESRFKQSFEDPLVRKSTTQLYHEEGGMRLYPFSERVYVTVTDDSGEVIEQGKYNRKVELDRTVAYVHWLEKHYPIPKGVTQLNEYDKRTGEVVNDFHLEPVTDTVPVMIGNLQVGMSFVRSEQIIPRSWEVAKFKEELRTRGSSRSRKNRGNEPVAGIVGLKYFEGLEADVSTPAAANDSEVDVPWNDTTVTEDEVAFQALPNPKLGDAKVQVPIIPKGSYVRSHPEFMDNLKLRPKKRAAKWVGYSPEQIQHIALLSWTEPDREVGLFSDPDYRFDPGPPVVDNVVKGPTSWFENKKAVIGHEFVGPPKPALVSPVTRNKESVRQKASLLLQVSAPPLPEGWRSHRRMETPRMNWIHPVTVSYWVRKFAEQRTEMREHRQYNAWLKERARFKPKDEAIQYKEWHRLAVTHVIRPEELQEHLGNMEAVAPSVKPVYRECKVCEANHTERIAKEALALRKKRHQAKNPYGLPTIAAKLKAEENRKNKAIMESAGSGPAKIGEPVIRVSSPVKLNPDSTGDGQVSEYNLQNFSPAERTVFINTLKGKVTEPSLWNKLKSFVPSGDLESAISNWVNRGTLLVPPAYG